MSVLAVDLGSDRIGLACSEAGVSIALPIGNLPVPGGATIQEIADAVIMEATKRSATVLVIGHPLHLDGREGKSAQKARSLAEAIRAKAAELQVVLWDERFTTVSALKSLRQTGTSPSRKRELVDRVAATILLQSYLDFKSEASEWDRQHPNVGAEPKGRRPKGRGGAALAARRKKHSR